MWIQSRQIHPSTDHMRTLFRQNWIVYANPVFGGPEQVIRYLGRYTL
jgi:hypothetical protein